MCNSIQGARKRRETKECFASLMSVADTHLQGAAADRRIYSYYEQGSSLPDANSQRDNATSSGGYRGREIDTAGSQGGAKMNYGVAVSNEFCSGSLADLLGYEPMKKVSPDGSLSPPFSAGAGDRAQEQEQHLSASYDDDNTGDAPVKKKHQSQQLQQQRRILDTGITAKGHQRQFAKHNYHDHANDEVTSSPLEPNPCRALSLLTPMRGGVMAPFPLRLHNMLESVETENATEIVCWQPHGRAFVVKDPKRFVRQIMPRYFRQHKYSSFQRQLNLYGFMRLTKKGPDHGGYYHELFLRDRLHLCASMQRVRVKGTLVRTSSSPQTEPDFYTMPFVERIRGDGVMQLEDFASNTDNNFVSNTDNNFASNTHNNFVPRPSYGGYDNDGDDMPPVQPLQRPYPVHSTNPALTSHHHTFPTVAALPDERRSSALSRRLGMHRTPSEEADLARFLEEVDLYASDVETTAAV